MLEKCKGGGFFGEILLAVGADACIGPRRGQDPLQIEL